MGSIDDIMELCRLCLVKDQVNIPIFDETSDIRQTFLKINQCLPVKVSRDDNLPKKICDGCSYKLDMLYVFRNTSVDSEKQLISWLSQLGSTCSLPQTLGKDGLTKPEVMVKQEKFETTETRLEGDTADVQGDLGVDAHSYIIQQQKLPYQQDFADFGEPSGSAVSEEPPPKRAKRAAAVKKTVHVEEEEDALETAMQITKAEQEEDSDDVDQPDYVEAPSTSADDQPGPSGVGKGTIEAPMTRLRKLKIKQKKGKDYQSSDEEYCPKPKKRRYDVNKTWPCKKCGQVLQTRRLYRSHRQTHVEEEFEHHTYKFDEVQELYTCNTCSAEYQEKEEVEKHIKTHEEIFECSECGEKFKKAYSYGTHLATHNEDKLCRCPLCSYKTPKRTSLLIHINYVHLKKFYYGCTTCGKGFNDVVQFKEHENEHLGLRPFVCVVCNKDFAYSRYLLTHQVRYHRVGIEGTLLPNQCNVCHKVFTRPGTLQQHVQLHVQKKTREKKHLCDLCGKGFAQKNKLRIHYRVHTGFKPYTCSYCAKSFTKKEYLVMHERVHSGEKPYACEYCGKCFSQGAPLRIHLRIHTGERPYVCQFCSAGFTSKGGLNIHWKSCTGYSVSNRQEKK